MAYDVIVLGLDPRDKKMLLSDLGKELLSKRENIQVMIREDDTCVAKVRFLRGKKVQLDNKAIITQIHETRVYGGINEKQRKVIGLIHGIIIDAMKNLRDDECSQYKACLDYAESEGWRSFSCLSCPLKEKTGNKDKGTREEVEDLFREEAGDSRGF